LRLLAVSVEFPVVYGQLLLGLSAHHFLSRGKEQREEEWEVQGDG